MKSHKKRVSTKIKDIINDVSEQFIFERATEVTLNMFKKVLSEHLDVLVRSKSITKYIVEVDPMDNSTNLSGSVYYKIPNKENYLGISFSLCKQNEDVVKS